MPFVRGGKFPLVSTPLLPPRKVTSDRRDGLAEALSPTYIQLRTDNSDGWVPVDGWGYYYVYWSDGRNYLLVSPGRDGEYERDWSRGLEGGPFTGFDADIVYEDGRFVTYPEGSPLVTPR